MPRSREIAVLRARDIFITAGGSRWITRVRMRTHTRTCAARNTRRRLASPGEIIGFVYAHLKSETRNLCNTRRRLYQSNYVRVRNVRARTQGNRKHEDVLIVASTMLWVNGIVLFRFLFVG